MTQKKKSNIKKWAENLIEEVYSEWKTKYSFWKRGFIVFDSPVIYRPKLLIISLNPGGDEESFQDDLQKFKGGDFSVPKKNSYVITDWKISKQIRDVFEGNLDILKTSVVTRVLFFRSEREKYWENNNPEKTRLAMEKFSYDKVQEIIGYVEPKRILIIGNSAFGRFKKIQQIQDEKKLEKFGTTGTIIRAKTAQYGILVLPHLSGAHGISDERKQRTMRKELRIFLKS